MRYILLLLVLGVTKVAAQQSCQVILVRHAEKAIDHPQDPSLNPAGVLRSQRLFELFKNQEFAAVYSTNYKRTKATVIDLANHNQLEISEYASFAKAFWSDVIQENLGKTIIVSGHSNTTPLLVNMFIGEERIPQLKESEYGNIYIVNISEIGNGNLMILNY